MAENVLDVLMYLFENYMDSETELDTDQDSLRHELQAAGFAKHKVNKALSWLEGLSERAADTPFPAERSVRIYADVEMERLNPECRGFLLYLEQAGVIGPASRELVIERIMALEHVDIDLERLKWIILMVLFNQPGQEAAYAWMEDFMFDSTSTQLH